MKTAVRFSLERIAAFDGAIRAGEYPNAKTIARRLEVSHRTAQRDVEFLRDRLRAPLAFDPRRNGFYYTDPAYRLSFLELSDEEVMALLLAQGASRQLGSPFAAEMARAVRKVVGGMADGIAAELDVAHSFRFSASSLPEPALLRALDAAIRGRRRLAIRYYSASRDAETAREVDPYHLATVDGRAYLVARCALRAEVRMFVPSRIRAAEPTGATFEPPGDFRIDEYLARSFAVMRGADEEVYRVRLRFTGEAVRYVRERTWHSSQTLEDTPDGGLILGLTVGHLREVERFVLSWGSSVEAIGPPELRERLGRVLSVAAGYYASSDG